MPTHREKESDESASSTRTATRRTTGTTSCSRCGKLLLSGVHRCKYLRPRFDPLPTHFESEQRVPRPVTVRAETQRAMFILVLDEMTTTFTKEDFAVKCFERYPHFFGMHAYPYPDTVNVYSKFYGATGLLAQGWIEQTPSGSFRATEKTRDAARILRPTVVHDEHTARIPASRDEGDGRANFR